MKSIFVCVTAVSMAALVSPAFAGKPKAPVGNAANGLKEMRELNLIVLGNMSAGADVEGKTFVGGNLSNANTYGSGRSGQSPLATKAFSTLTVVGNVTGTANINSGISPGGATVGGNLGGMNLNASNATVLVGGSIGSTNGGNGATIKVGGTIGTPRVTGKLVEQNLGAKNFTNPLVANLDKEQTTMTADLKSLSSVLAGLTATGTFNGSNSNDATFTSKDPGHLGYSVIDITGAQLTQYEKAGSFAYNVTEPTIINVIGGGSITESGNTIGTAPDHNDLLFNFVGATNVTLNTDVPGSVLAPSSSVTIKNDIEGTLVAAGLTQGGELHQFGFSSPLTGVVGIATPEPATWAMMFVGFGFAGALLRRRRVVLAA